MLSTGELAKILECCLDEKHGCYKCPLSYADGTVACKEFVEGNASIPMPVIRNVIDLLKEQNNCENCAIAIEDRQHVVRCKDCKYSSGRCLGVYIQFIMCGKTGGIHKDDWFCADGEMRETND